MLLIGVGQGGDVLGLTGGKRERSLWFNEPKRVLKSNERSWSSPQFEDTHFRFRCALSVPFGFDVEAHVHRGGCWWSRDPYAGRIAYRLNATPVITSIGRGFRCRLDKLT